MLSELGRRSNAAAPKLPLSTTSPVKRNESCNNEEPKETSSSRKRRRHLKCSYRGVVVSCALVILYLLLMATNPRRLRASPCQVARDFQATLQRIQQLQQQQDSTIAQLPKIIHHQWKDEKIPDKYKQWHEAWYRLYPDYTHMLWTDKSARELIQQHYSWFLKVYDSYPYNIQRADAARYFYLHHYGGVHVDLDYEPLSSDIFNYLPTMQVGLVESPYKFSEETQNSFMSSPKGNPFWLDVFETLVQHKEERVLSATGPKLLDAAIQHSSHNVSILPCELFHRIPLGEHSISPMVTNVARELLGRFYPMKQCGDYEDDTCHYARHHNTASYVADSGW